MYCFKITIYLLNIFYKLGTDAKLDICFVYFGNMQVCYLGRSRTSTLVGTYLLFLYVSLLSRQWRKLATQQLAHSSHIQLYWQYISGELLVSFRDIAFREGFGRSRYFIYKYKIIDDEIHFLKREFLLHFKIEK